RAAGRGRHPAQGFALFFFQAEDGIRAGHVTGVQTCALPILVPYAKYTRLPRAIGPCTPCGTGIGPVEPGSCPASPKSRMNTGFRSEERRVGKEGRCGWPRVQLRKKRGGPG